MTDTPPIVAREIELVPAGRLRPHPNNPRNHDVDRIRALIRANGFNTAIAVQRSDVDGRHAIVYGNGRYEAGLAEGMVEFPVIWLDVDDPTASALAVGDNHGHEGSSYDEAELADLLAELDALGHLAETGYTTDVLAELRAGLDATVARANARDAVPAAARKEQFDQSVIRQIVLVCDVDHFNRAVRQMAALRAGREFDSNTALVLALLDEAATADGIEVE